MTSIFMPHMKVFKVGWKYILHTFCSFLIIITCDIKIDLTMCEPHYVKLFFMKPSLVKLFDFLTFDDIFHFQWK